MLSRLISSAAIAAFVSGAALAADLPSRAAAPILVAPPAFTWTGFYVGTLTGYAFSDRQTVRTVGNNNGAGGLTDTQLNVALSRRPPVIGLSQSDLTSVGGGGGYDYQFTPGAGLVVGAAADATYTDLERRRAYFSPAQPANGFVPEISTFRQRLDYLTTLRGRVGYAFDRFLVYGTGGFAFGNVLYRANFFRNTDAALVYAGRYDSIETGFVYGGGIEYAIPPDSFLGKFNLLSYLNLIQTRAVTVKVEYLHYDLGGRNVLVNNVLPGGPTGSYTSRFKTEGDIVRGGFTYRFGGL